jgi:hypothetical protein
MLRISSFIMTRLTSHLGQIVPRSQLRKTQRSHNFRGHGLLTARYRL